MEELLKKLGKLRLVPVVKIDHADDADGLAEALVEGGLPCAEITFRTDAAEAAIRKVAKRNDMLVGAGTVLSVENVKKAVDAGAKFIVSPGINPKVVEYCVSNSIPITPGVCTPTDVELGMSFGLTALKFFPAEAMGGLKTLKAISAPYTMVTFIPTGGINAKNVGDYLSFNKVLCCGGSWMVKGELITAHRFEEITALTKEAVEIAKN